MFGYSNRQGNESDIEMNRRKTREENIWNEAIEKAAYILKTSYPEHSCINAYCACVRSLKKEFAETSEAAKMVWNAAIEEAALKVAEKIKYPTEACAIIRSLKK